MAAKPAALIHPFILKIMFDLLNTPVTLETVLAFLKSLSQPNAIETILNLMGGILDQFETDNIDLMRQAIEAHENGYIDRDDLIKLVRICANPKPTPAQLNQKEQLEKTFR